MKKIAILMALVAVFIIPGEVSARRSDAFSWYIEDFKTQIVVNKDSSLTITEDILADCGNAQGKHGIFRILPTVINTTSGRIKTPIRLISITDFEGRSYKYAESYDTANKTVIWKIGDPNKTVSGENSYRIKYAVQNAVRTENSKKFDELYWNLSGNYWDLEIDNLTANIIFPSEISKDNASISYYSGYAGDKGTSLAEYQWIGDNTLEFKSTRPMKAKEGITASIAFPKNIVTPYKAGLLDYLNFEYFWLLLPVFVFIVCYKIWRKYGDDPDFKKTVIAEYAPPEGLTPLEVGMLQTNGALKQEFITGSIISLAVTGFINIKEIVEKGMIFDSKDYEIFKTDISPDEKISRAEQKIYSKLFALGDSVKLSSLKNKFYIVNKEVEDSALNNLDSKGLIEKTGAKLKGGFMVAGMVLIFGGAYFTEESWLFAVSVILSGIIIIIIGAMMVKRTLAGAEMNWKIKGFKLYMDTAEKYRQEFYEKENIFEKYLPYAIIFGITSQWISKMKDIYGAEYFNAYHPVWYGGQMSGGGFDADGFSKSISSLSSAITASTSSPSGQGGGGSSGGGGGGGGGGGW